MIMTEAANRKVRGLTFVRCALGPPASRRRLCFNVLRRRER